MIERIKQIKSINMIRFPFRVIDCSLLKKQSICALYRVRWVLSTINNQYVQITAIRLNWQGSPELTSTTWTASAWTASAWTASAWTASAWTAYRLASFMAIYDLNLALVNV